MEFIDNSNGEVIKTSNTLKLSFPYLLKI
jgi:hypothetical protein